MHNQMTESVLIPLLNPNEPDAVLADLYVSEGHFVHKGDLLCSLETTKSTADVTAESDGYIRALSFSKGQRVHAGELFCYISSDPDWTPPDKEEGTSALPEGIRITRPALELARRLNLDLSRMPANTLITEAIVRAHASPVPEATNLQRQSQPGSFDPTSIVIYGGGGHGKMVIDLLRARGGFRIIGLIDDGLERGSMIMGAPVLGNASVLPDLHSQGVRLAVNSVGGIGDIRVRIKIFERLADAGFACPAITHPTAYLDPSASLEAGSQVMAMAYVGSEAKLGFGCIVNTGAIISHDCRLESFTIISPGALLAGNVQVGEGALIGMGVTVNLGVKIGRGARLGNGATVKSDVPESGVVRAGTVWPI